MALVAEARQWGVFKYAKHNSHSDKVNYDRVVSKLLQR